MLSAVADTVISGIDLPVDTLTDADLRGSLQASAVLLGRIQVLQAKLLTEAQARQLWRRDGFRSLASWLADKTAMTAHDARRAVDTASIISTRSDIAASMAEGQISPAHVAVLRSLADEDATAEPAADSTEPTAPVVDPADLLAAACTQSPEAFARHARVLRAQADPEGEARRYLVRRSRRSLRSWTDADGLLHMHLAIDPGFGAIIERAISAMCEQRWRRDHPDRALTLEPRAAYDQRRADALFEICQRVLSGDGVDAVGGSCVDVVALINVDVLFDRLEREGVATLVDGTPIPAGLARLWACENGVLPAVLSGKSVPLDYGAKRRFASAAQRQALLLRSATCEFAGCTLSNYACRAHHLSWWTDTHNSDYDNLALVCHTHHQMIHLEKWQLRGGPGNSIETYRPDGSRFVAARDHDSRNHAAHQPPRSPLRTPLPSYGHHGRGAPAVMAVP
jgi:hypothetical protein